MQFLAVRRAPSFIVIRTTNTSITSYLMRAWHGKTNQKKGRLAYARYQHELIGSHLQQLSAYDEQIL